MKCWFCFGMGRVAPENWDLKGMIECPECQGTGLTHCPYCDEPVQLKGDDLLAWCPEHGVLENDLKRGGSVPGCVNDGEQTQP